MKKRFTAILAILLVVSAFAFAGGANETQTAKADGKYSGVTLNYWSMWNSNEKQGQVIQKAVDAFEADTGATVNIEWKGRDINKVIQASLEAGDAIDIFDDDYQRIGKSYAKYTYDLTEMAAADNYAAKSYAGLNNESIKLAGFLNSITEQPQVGGIFYNKDIFDACGVTTTPTTWAEFLDVCQKLVDNGYQPMALDSAYADFWFGYHLDRRIGSEEISKLALNGGWANNAGAVAAAQDMIDFINAGYLADGAPDEYPSSQNKIGLTGKVAMVVCANYVKAEVDNVAGEPLNWGLLNYPMIPVADGGTGVANAYAGANSFAIASYSKNPQAAYDLIMYIVTGKYDQEMADTVPQIPADPRNTEPAAELGSQAALKATVAPLAWNAGLNDNSDLKTAFKSTIIQLYEGKFATGADFCKAMDALY